MFAVTPPSLLKRTDPNLLFARICKKIIEDLFKNFYVSLGTTILYLSTKKLEVCIFCAI